MSSRFIPPELVICIVANFDPCVYLDRKTLKSLRLTSREYGLVATKLLFTVLSVPRGFANTQAVFDWCYGLHNSELLGFLEVVKFNALSFVGVESLSSILEDSSAWWVNSGWQIQDTLREDWFAPLIKKLDEAYSATPLLVQRRGTKESYFFLALISLFRGLGRHHKLRTLLCTFDGYEQIQKFDRDGVLMMCCCLASSYCVANSPTVQVKAMRFVFGSSSMSLSWDAINTKASTIDETKRSKLVSKDEMDNINYLRTHGFGKVSDVGIWLPASFENLSLLTITNTNLGYITLRRALQNGRVKKLVLEAVALNVRFDLTSPKWLLLTESGWRPFPRPAWGWVFRCMAEEMPTLEEAVLLRLRYESRPEMYTSTISWDIRRWSQLLLERKNLVVRGAKRLIGDETRLICPVSHYEFGSS